MSREDACVEILHLHLGTCQRAGYANGRADALEEVLRAVTEYEGDLTPRNFSDPYIRGAEDIIAVVREIAAGKP